MTPVIPYGNLQRMATVTKSVKLPAELAPGQWRWLEAEDLARLADYTDPEA